MLSYRFAIQLEGADRKKIAETVAEALNTALIYGGSPTFAYTAKQWTIHRDRTLESPVLTLDKLENVRNLIEFLAGRGLKAVGNLRITVQGVSEDTAVKTSSVIKAKSALLRCSFKTENEIDCEWENRRLTFPFFPALMDAEQLTADIVFTIRLVEFAKNLKRTTVKEKPHDNEKYAMRCFLLRLGFIGSESKLIRKKLLQHMTGDAAFKSSERPAPKTTEVCPV